MGIKDCVYCGDRYESKIKTQMYCSKNCRMESMKIRKECEYCGNPFRTRHKSIYCSRSCSVKGSRGAKLINLECRNCGDIFRRKEHDIKGSKVGNFCNRSCWDKFNSSSKGKDHHRYSSKDVTCFYCGEAFVRETNQVKRNENQFCSSGCYMNHIHNPSLTDEERRDNRDYPEYREWRRSVYERDGYTCRKCYKVGSRIEAHHVFNFHSHPELRTEVGNGITFCVDCHKDFHKTYGNRYNNKDQVEEFI